jgi:spermidine synthase
MWFTEQWTPDIHFSVRIKEHLHSEKTPFQQMDFYDSYELGKFFSLDGIMMANEKDEFIYHEMIIHTPMSIHPDVKNVLVIGGGDGGSVRELTKYSSIKSIDLVEIDERVVRACQIYLPQMTLGFDDKRVILLFEDGLAYVKNTSKHYDLIIVDSTDPIGPGEGLFSIEFYKNCFRILNDDGILINQHESPYFEKEKNSEICRIFSIDTRNHWCY